MSTIAPPTPEHAPGWVRLTVSSGAAFWVNRTAESTQEYVPERVALDSFALTLLLARMPVQTEASIAPLITSGSLSLTCVLSADDTDVTELEKQLATHCVPAFIRSGTAVLRDSKREYATYAFSGTAARMWLGGSLPSATALGVLRALDGTKSGLRVEVRIPQLDFKISAALDALLNKTITPANRQQYVHWIVPHADGTVTEVPRVQAPKRETRAAPANVPLDLIAEGKRAVSLHFAMSAAQVHPTAAALAASGATAPAVPVTSRLQYFLANDAHLLLTGEDASQTPTSHLPLLDAPDASLWHDAIDPNSTWYAPDFTAVVPAANDDPAGAAFSFVYSSSGITLNDGGMRPGLDATLHITIDTKPPDGAAAGAQQVPLNNLSIALEIPYRQPGSTQILTQRFPGTVAQNGNLIAVDIPLLDDWVRLAYAALAYAPAAGMPAPRLIVDYAFTGYQWIQGGGISPGPLHVLNPGKIHALPIASTRAAASQHVDRPTVVASDLAVIGPTSYMQYRREGPPTRDIHAINNVALHATAIPLVPAVFPVRKYLVTRSIVREHAIDLSYPCGSCGAFYRQKSADGTTSSAIGCQDAFKLGETAAKAFEEITALRDPAYRVFRSLQQPGRFLALPSAYRIGRYPENAGADKAFRPTLLLYGQLGSDPAKDRYCMSMTLIADVSPYQLALLQTALLPFAPAQSMPEIVLPTDPFVGATLAYTWAIPSTMDQPQSVNVVDGFVVTLSMALDDAQLLTTIIQHSGVQGSVTFTLPDGTAFSSGLTIDGIIIGPPGTGPVTAQVANGVATLTNRTQQSVNVPDAAAVDASGKATASAVNASLDAGATTTFTPPAGTVTVIADARASQPASIDELDVFVEDVTLTITFINQVSFANHQLSALSVQSRLANTDHIVTTDLPENAVGTATFTLPITTYLAQRTLEYSLAETTTTGSKNTAWYSWDLTKGSVIGITADLL
jgi:hypothetical protein